LYIVTMVQKITHIRTIPFYGFYDKEPQ